MILRAYKKNDVSEMADLFYHTVHTINARDYTKEQLNVWATGSVDQKAWESSFLEHDTRIAEEDGKIIGFADMDESGYLDRLYVHKDYQGKGVATALCDSLETAHSGKRFTTHASITARPFFENRGYRVKKEQKVERGGILLTNFVMEKPAINEREVDLSGVWKMELDRYGLGEDSHWEKETFQDEIQIPGILQEQGYGEEITKSTDWVQSLYDPLWYEREEYKYGQESITNVPFLSQPPRHYTGKAWYQTSFWVSKEQESLWSRFFLECTKWKTTVWLDGKKVGDESSLCTPHCFETGKLKTGLHQLVICVDNGWQFPYRPDGHGVSDALAATWNGMVGKTEIQFVPMIELVNIRVETVVPERKAVFHVLVKNHGETACEAEVAVSGQNDILQANGCHRRIKKHHFPVGESVTKLELVYPQDTPLWDEFSPHLETAVVEINSEYGNQRKPVSFGFREICVKNGMFFVNQRPSYFRGTHFGGDFPLTGYPSCDKAWWGKIMDTVRDWGLNYIRFHSYCPPQAAFEAADEAGVYLQVECGMWNVFCSGIQMNEILMKEAMRIVECFGNHPSFVMLSPSNEPGGDWMEPLGAWVGKMKQYDDRRLYTIQSGWPYPMPPEKISGTDYVYFHRSGYGMEPGGTIRNYQGWKGKDYRASLEGIHYPVICHELGQWCSYPDFSVIDKFKGYMRPGNYTVFMESAKANDVYTQNKEFSYHSGRQQVAMYKEDLEANFRTPHIYGFELLDIHDYLGQGTALVGVLDPFWEEKGYVQKEEWKKFCNETVVLARLNKRTYVQTEALNVPVELCHFGRYPLKQQTIWWKMVDQSGTIVEKGTFPSMEIPLGKNLEVGEIRISLSGKKAPMQYEIQVGIGELGIENSWDIYIYKAVESNSFNHILNRKKDDGEEEESCMYTRSWKEAMEGLQRGKRVLFSPDPGSLSYDCPPLRFRPVFWNAQMGPTWGRGMGMICKSDHRALRGFPTQSSGGWQWESILEGARGFQMKYLNKQVDMIVQPIDEWNRNYKLGMIFSCCVGKGKLLVAMADLEHELQRRPEAAALLESLWDYINSEEFDPQSIVTVEELTSVFFPNDTMEQLQVTAIWEEKPDEDLSAMLDGSADTFIRLEGGHPYHIRLKMRQPVKLSGILYVPRQNQREHEGDIRTYKVEYESEGQWREIAAGTLPSSFSPKKILFESGIITEEIRFTVLDGFSGRQISFWKQEQDGWYKRKKDFEDSILSIAVLSLIPEETLIERKTNGLIKENYVMSATKEIEA